MPPEDREFEGTTEEEYFRGLAEAQTEPTSVFLERSKSKQSVFSSEKTKDIDHALLSQSFDELIRKHKGYRERGH